MKRTPLTRRTPMRRTPISRHSPRKHAKPREWRPDASDAETVFREDVQRRSRGICELCGKAPAIQIHHRRSRSVAWSCWLDVNGLDLCRRCHLDVIHANPEWAYKHGLLLHRSSTRHPRPITGCGLACVVDHFA